MSDQKLRELERRWKETGSPEDEATWLLERVRVGDLTRERLELAAYCGHEGAKRLVQSPDVPADLWDWAKGLGRWEKRTVAFVAAEAAESVLYLWTSAGGTPEPERCLTVTKAWLDCPCEAHREAASRIYEETDPRIRHRRGMTKQAGSAAFASVRAAGAAGARELDNAAALCASAVQGSANAMAGTYDAAGGSYRVALLSKIATWSIAGK